MSNSTIFIKLTAEKEKEMALKCALENKNSANRFERDVTTFSIVPGSPFSYWVDDKIRLYFKDSIKFCNKTRRAKQGIATADNFRFIRSWWETDSFSANTSWHLFAKGGSYSPYYKDLDLLIDWRNGGSQIENYVNPKTNMPYSNIWQLKSTIENYFFKPGITWPLRTHKFAPSILPAGSIFSVRGQAVFFDNQEEIFAFIALCNSEIFDYFFKMSLGRFGHPEFVIGVLQNVPIPELSSNSLSFLSERAQLIWHTKQNMDQYDETSHAFILPTAVIVNGDSILGKYKNYLSILSVNELTLTKAQAEIEDRCWSLYEISKEDRASIIDPGGSVTATEDDVLEPIEQDEDIEENQSTTPESLSVDLVSWLFGAAMGRWDAALATGERPIPPLPGPFDKLPPVSRGMLLGADGLHPAKDAMGRFMPEHDLLVDDEGENLDLVRRVREVLERVVGERADAWLLELESLLGSDLRAWYRRTFFERHLKRYSKSRRKAPIYWQLGTPSGSYSVWLYYPRLTRDSLFRLLNDVVKPKVAYEEQCLAVLREQNARRSELEPQEALVEELQAFRDEVARVTPLFDPNLDDGVLINAAPLHRLFVHAGWRRDTRAAWTQLVRGDFEWSQMALHLWPERVIPQCSEQRHLALAHDLEGPLKTRSVEDLVAAHTRPAVKDALQSLLNASPLAGGRSAGRPARTPRALRSAPEPRAAAEPTPRAPRASAEVPEATIVAIREVLARFPGGAAKSDVIAATGLPDGTWNTAIAQLLATGDVERQGEKRGTRYFLKA